MFGEGFMNEFNIEAGADVLSTHHNIDISGMKKTKEQKEQEVQQQMVAQGMETMGSAISGPVAQGMVDKNIQSTE